MQLLFFKLCFFIYIASKSYDVCCPVSLRGKLSWQTGDHMTIAHVKPIRRHPDSWVSQTSLLWKSALRENVFIWYMSKHKCFIKLIKTEGGIQAKKLHEYSNFIFEVNFRKLRKSWVCRKWYKILLHRFCQYIVYFPGFRSNFPPLYLGWFYFFFMQFYTTDKTLMWNL